MSHSQKVTFTSLFPVWVEPSLAEFTYFLLRAEQPHWSQAGDTRGIEGQAPGPGRAPEGPREGRWPLEAATSAPGQSLSPLL